MIKMIAALLGVLLVSQCALAQYYGGYGGLGYGGGYGGYGGLGYGGIGIGVAEVVEPVIPVSSGVVDVRGYVDSFSPGSSYCGYGTYGPAYGGLGYPIEAFGYGGPLLGGLGGPIYGGVGIY